MSLVIAYGEQSPIVKQFGLKTKSVKMQKYYRAPPTSHPHCGIILILLFLTGLLVYDYFYYGAVRTVVKKTIHRSVAEVNSSIFYQRPKPRANRSFVIDYKNDQFLKDGKPFHYISGAMHYFRIPRAYWRDRLRKYRAAGLNAVSVYIEWVSHEPSPRNYQFTGQKDLEYFLQVATEEDLLILLRPGPYICAERDLGGLPPWLMSLYPNIAMRTNDTDYIREVKTWFDVLYPKLQKYLYGNGGNVIMVQIENEYGCFYKCQKSMEYKLFLRDLIKSYVKDDAVLYTTDPAGCLSCGAIPGAYATVDFPPTANVEETFKEMRKYSPQGPLICSEYYDGWFTLWEEPRSHQDIALLLKTTKQLLEMKVNFNIYPLHGGTNFNFSNTGNMERNGFRSVTTSYDFEAALNESGDPTPKYYALRKLFSEYVHMPKIPVPKPAAKGNYGEVTLKPVLSIFDHKQIPEAKTVQSNKTMTFEELHQKYGYVLYETTIPENLPDPSLLSADGLKDRANVFVNRNPVTIFTRSQKIYSAAIQAPAGALLSFLVENLGRAAGAPLEDKKGLLREPTLNGNPLYSWTITGLPFENVSWSNTIQPQEKKIEPPAVYVGELVLPSNGIPLDTFFDPTGWGKGVIFVNGVNLGRYWPSIGCQVTLYVPGCFLLPAPQKNIITLFETEYTHPELKIVFTDKSNLDKMPPKPQYEDLMLYQHTNNINYMRYIQAFGDGEQSMVPKRRVKRV